MSLDTITPTAERIRHAGERYVPPATDQKQSRPYSRLLAWFEVLTLREVLYREQGQAARDLDMFWHGANAVRGITASYGDQRWNGTPVGQMTVPAMLGPEWRETCRRKLREARDVIGCARTWDAVCFAIEQDASLTEIGRQAGASSDRTARRRGAEIIKAAMTKLAQHYGYLPQARRTPYGFP